MKVLGCLLHVIGNSDDAASGLNALCSFRPVAHYEVLQSSSKLFLALIFLASVLGISPVVVNGASLAPIVAAREGATNIKPNRILPPHSAPNPEFSLTDRPEEEDIRRVRLFSEPLVPSHRKPTAVENRQLAAALHPHAKRAKKDDFASLEQFIANHPDSPWTPSMLFNLGMEYINTGYYSKALPVLEQTWILLKDTTDPLLKPVADRTAGELALLYRGLGRTAELSTLLQSLEGRPIVGSATEKISGAKQGLWSLQHRPEIAFRCGPIALDRVRAQHAFKSSQANLIYNARITTNGYSLAQLAQLSVDLGMRYRMAYRDPDTTILVPAVVHWKLGHYAALLKEEQDRYLVEDLVFGGNVWVSRQALEDEISGYCLIPAGNTLPPGWRAVGEAEAGRIWGKCHTFTQDASSTTPLDLLANNSCPSDGMPVHNVHLMVVSLNLEDTPVGYAPPVGPQVYFRITYNQRESGQPAIFNYCNLGPKWTFNWLAFITDDPGNPSADVYYYTDGGGRLQFKGYDSTTKTFATQLKSQARLTRAASNRYEMLYPDGSKMVFSQPDSSSGTGRRVFLTQVVDPRGNAVRISYDSSYRVVAVTDAIGQVTTFSYQLGNDPLKITRVTDPFGRFSKLEYDANGRLWKVTDSIGLSSQFGYDAGDFIQSMTTPYGITSFVKGESGIRRWLEVTYPNGEKERVEYADVDSLGIPYSDPANSVPAGMETSNTYLYARNTFFWDRKAYAEAAGDYTKARIYHWLHTQDYGYAAGILESEKSPLENRVWFNYENQPNSIVVGGSAQPSVIGRVLDDGTTQIRRFQYNSLGQVTNSVDPVGRSMTYTYSTNHVDLLEMRQTTGTNNELIASFLYNTQHLPTAIWDAAGQRTTNTYNARGQLRTTTNPKNETTTFNYDTNGYLLSIDGPMPGSEDSTSFTYDAMGRVKSTTGSDGYSLTYKYDDLNRLTNITYPNGTFEAFTYDRLDRVKSRDRMGRETHYGYDALRQMILVEDPLHRVTRFEYCLCGSMSGLIDPMGRRTTWEYDVQGRTSAKQYVDGSRVEYKYEDTTSRLKWVRDEKGQFKIFEYYIDDNRKRISYPNAQIRTPTVTFTYDQNYNRLVSMVDGIGLTTWSNYPAGVRGALQTAAVDGPWANDTITYQYDELGRVTNRAINGVDQTFAFDPLGRPTNVVNALGSFNYSYDGLTTRLRYVTYPNGQSSHYEYFDKLGDQRLQRITHYKPDSSLISRFTYAYNTFGNITNWVQERGLQMEAWSISYDDADQLLKVLVNQDITNTLALIYNYDPAGNQLSNQQNSVIRWFNYNALNQMASSSDSYSRNAEYEWDAEQRLVAIVSGVRRSEFLYDGLGRRIRIAEKENNVLQSEHTYLWCGFNICEERDASGGIPLKRFFAPGESFVEARAVTNYFYTADHLGSTREILDSDARIVNRFSYSPYGGRTAVSDPLQSSFGFTGHFEHKASGLSLTLFRAYSGDQGRWISRDPIGEVAGANLYAYVWNNPINATDSHGLWVDTFADAGFIAYDLYQLGTDKCHRGENLAALGLDLVGAAVPFATGLGAAYRTVKVTKAVKRLGKLTKTGDNIWDSIGGLRYAGKDKDGLNRIEHVLRHAEPDPTKVTHTVFNVGRDKVLGLVDEAWGMRGNPLANDPGAYVVPMGRTVGTGGENAVKIIVRPGSNEIITAYPVLVP